MSDQKQYSELKPEIVFIFDLVRQLVDGQIRIPRFQRKFVWRPDQMLDLLDSINLQYPIGSLLAWETATDIVTLDSVGPIRLSDRSDSQSSALYILDGHQRLSTIAGALVGESDRVQGPGDEDSVWNIYYNIKDSYFEHLPLGTAPGAHQFPMSRILDTFEFLEECQRVIVQDPLNGRAYVQEMQAVSRTFQTYKIPVIQIKQTGLTEAVEIFARLNSKGQAMTADQMVSALLYREDTVDPFDLAGEITQTMEYLNSVGFGEIDRTLVLRALLAAIGEDIYRTDWTRIALERREELLRRLRSVIPGVNISIAAAIEFLRDEGVRTERLIPYGMQLFVISSFFFACPDPSDVQLALIKKWFWVSSFSAWFGSANPSRVNTLMRDVIDNVAVNRSDPKFVSFDMKTQAVPIPRSFDMRAARTRVLLLVLFSLKPLTRNGDLIESPELEVQTYGPLALGYISNTSGDRELRRGPANRILNDEMSDRRQAKSWLEGLKPEVPRDSKILTSHAIPLKALESLLVKDLDGFLRLRLDEMRRIETHFMSERDVTPPFEDNRS
ncbi:DUF262 domain-containing protein [Agreia sp. PsM10]|uniref:DUF262 domain-containing protein n=1 Tax=Agreia sp. PsM10 TaxID=3030533 RepID=UPI00263B8E29|nr:DUF262 domain-containing protein [Agreia sp. PsM10]MDN4641498.1 DUF262 domain-containing protein [Agreia sp. PsM10]